MELFDRVLYMKSIRKLEDKWIHKDTLLTQFENKIIVANPNFPPMEFLNGEWNEISFSTKPI